MDNLKSLTEMNSDAQLALVCTCFVLLSLGYFGALHEPLMIPFWFGFLFCFFRLAIKILGTLFLAWRDQEK
jgi:hypothetical protein